MARPKGQGSPPVYRRSQWMTKEIKALKELIQDVEANYFIPKKFRKAPFTEPRRNQYLQYLKAELRRLEARLQNKAVQ